MHDDLLDAVRAARWALANASPLVWLTEFAQAQATDRTLKGEVADHFKLLCRDITWLPALFQVGHPVITSSHWSRTAMYQALQAMPKPDDDVVYWQFALVCVASFYRTIGSFRWQADRTSFNLARSLRVFRPTSDALSLEPRHRLLDWMFTVSPCSGWPQSLEVTNST